MQIQILSVTVNTVPTAKGSYQVAEVAYKDEAGKVSGKKVMSFSNQKVFDALKIAQAGEVYTVASEKDAKGYWQWTSISKGADTSVKPQATSNPSPKSNYETPEERAQRQVYIIRQSSLTNAVSLLAATGDKKATPETVIAIAKQFEAYVLDKAFDDGSISTLPEDVIE